MTVTRREIMWAVSQKQDYRDLDLAMTAYGRAEVRDRKYAWVM